MPGKFRNKIASNQKLQKAKTIIRFEAKGLRSNLKKKIRRLFLRTENFAALRGVSFRTKAETFDIHGSYGDSSSLSELAEELSFAAQTSPGSAIESSIIIPVFNK